MAINRFKQQQQNISYCGNFCCFWYCHRRKKKTFHPPLPSPTPLPSNLSNPFLLQWVILVWTVYQLAWMSVVLVVCQRQTAITTTSTTVSVGLLVARQSLNDQLEYTCLSASDSNHHQLHHSWSISPTAITKCFYKLEYTSLSVSDSKLHLPPPQSQMEYLKSDTSLHSSVESS